VNGQRDVIVYDSDNSGKKLSVGKIIGRLNSDNTFKIGETIYGSDHCEHHITWRESLSVHKRLFNSTIGRATTYIDLYRKLMDASKSLREYATTLEQKVEERTVQLKNVSDVLSSYLSKPVVNKIVDGRVEEVLKHEKRKVTIFTSDIKGFSITTEAMEPEDMAELLNRDYFPAMHNIIDKYEGTLIDTYGDALFGIFGAPSSTTVEEDALRCVMMALEMQWKMKEFGQKWLEDGIEHPLKIRFAINSGWAICGNYGTEERRKYAALGKDVNLVSRLEKVCEEGNILISHATYALIKDKISCKEAGKIEAKGFHLPKATYVVELDKITPDYLQEVYSGLQINKETQLK